MKKTNHPSKALFTLISLVLLAGAFGVGYILGNLPSTELFRPTSTNNINTPVINTFSDTNLGVAFQYPTGWSAMYDPDIYTIVVKANRKVPCIQEGNTDPSCTDFAILNINAEIGKTVKDIIRSNQLSYEGMPTESVTIGPHTWTAYTLTGIGGYYVWSIELGGKAITVTTSYNSYKELKDQIDDILASITAI